MRGSGSGGNSWSLYGFDGEEVVQAGEVVGVGGVEGDSADDGDGGDHEVGDSAAWCAAGGENCGADHTECAGGVGVERKGLEGSFGMLEHVGASGPFGWVGGVVGSGREFGKGDGADHHFVWEVCWVECGQVYDDVGVDEAARDWLTRHG